MIPALGHNYQASIDKNATIFEKGQKKVWCNRNGCSLATSVRYEDIPALYSTPVVDSDQTPATEDSEYVYFGIFPKTIKAESVTIDETESNSKTMGANKYYKGSDGEWYVKCLEDADATSDRKYSNGVQAKDISANSYAWFRVEPIKWKVLTKDYNGTGKALLLADDILTAKVRYHEYMEDRTINGETVYANNYEYSKIRAYLNGLDYYDGSNSIVNTYSSKGFLQTAFTTDAQNLISVTTVDNSGDSTTDAAGILPKADGTAIKSGSVEEGNVVYYPDYTCENTTDKIFLLSEREVTTASYGFGEYRDKGIGNSRIRFSTDYAKANYAGQSRTSGWGVYWWLRSPSSNDSVNARGVRSDGRASWDEYVSMKSLGVVPALTISFNQN